MFTVPVTLLAGRPDPGPEPLLNFAPGDTEDPWGTGDQLPPEQPFFYSAAAMTAAGVTAAPYTIYGFQESAGTPPQDLVGSNHMSIAGSVLQDQPAVGFFKNGSFSDLSKRCVQLDTVQTASDYFYVNAHDPGSDSFACFAIVQYPLFINNTSLFGKRASGLFNGGWALNNPHRLKIANGSTYSNRDAGTALGGGQWMAVMIYINRTTNLATLHNSVTSSVPWDISTWGSITSPDPFQIGEVDYASGNHMVAYMAFWSGAAAESIEANHVANWDRLWKHGAAPQNCPIIRSGLIGEGATLVGDRIVSTRVGYAAGLGQLHSGWMGGSWGGAANSRCQFPWAWNPGLSRSNRLGMQSSANDAYRTSFAGSYSDSLNSSEWTKTNITVSTAIADRALGPDGTLFAYMLTSTSDPNSIGNSVRDAVPGETQGVSLMFRRGKNEVADVVDCRLYIYDVENAAIIDTVLFTATDEWQTIEFEVVVPAGCAHTRQYIGLPTWVGVDRSIHVMKATACGTTYFDMMPPPSFAYSGEVVGLANVRADYAAAAGSCMKGAQGEIELVFICDGNYVNGDRSLFTQKSATGNYSNGHLFSLNTSKQVVVKLYNNSNAVVSTLTSAAIADLTTETTVVYRWNVAGLPSGDKHEISINGGAFTGFNPAAWTYDDTIVDFHYGAAPPTTPDIANALKASIRIWEFPR